MSARRGDVWLIDFGESVGSEQAGRRPGVVVSADRLNESPASVVIVVPCTRARRNLPSHIEIEPGQSGLDETSYAKCEDVKSISEHRLVARLGVAGDETLFALSRTLGFLLDF